MRQVGKLPQLRWDLPNQEIGGKEQLCHMPGRVRVYPVPLPERCIGQPIVVVVPVRAAGSFMEGFQNLALRQNSTLSPGALVLCDRTQPNAEPGIVGNAQPGVSVPEFVERQICEGLR